MSAENTAFGAPSRYLYEDAARAREKSQPTQQEDIHMGEPGFLHKLFRRKRLEGVFLFITGQCNSRCRTCFYHEKLNKNNDLAFDQIRRISETSPRFDKLWLSGG